MVFVKTERGGFHEPPYTEEEKAELLWRMTGTPVAFSSPQHRNPKDTKHAVSPKSRK